MTTNTNNKQRITLFIDPLLVKHARARAVIEDISLAELVSKALLSHLPEETVIKKNGIKLDFDHK